MKHALGVGLSGGGIRCVAHLGILNAWFEQGIKPDIYAGTSAGALAGALIAAGKCPDAIMEKVTTIGLLQLFQPAFRTSGLLNIQKTLALFLEDLPLDFADLQTPLQLGTTNFRTGEQRIFSSGNLHQALLASCCMPVIFDSVIIEGDPYVDGGLLANLPVRSLKDKADFVVGIHTNPVSSDFVQQGFKSLIERSLLITINTNVQHDRQYCDLFIEPHLLAKYKVFDMRKASQIYQESYAWARIQDWAAQIQK